MTPQERAAIEALAQQIPADIIDLTDKPSSCPTCGAVIEWEHTNA